MIRHLNYLWRVASYFPAPIFLYEYKGSSQKTPTATLSLGYTPVAYAIGSYLPMAYVLPSYTPVTIDL